MNCIITRTQDWQRNCSGLSRITLQRSYVPLPASPLTSGAAGGCRWDATLVIARAPGRLDVMGGIADYSGSLVLQMAIGEAAHVALQLQDEGKHCTWVCTRGATPIMYKFILLHP